MRIKNIYFFLLVFSALLYIGCESAVIDRFDARPGTLCCGTTVQLDWETSNATRTQLSKSPGGPITGPGPTGYFEEDGSYMDPGVCEDTTYTLTALHGSGGGNDTEQATVEVLSGSEEHILGAVGSCDSEGEPVWGATRSLDEWDSQIVVRNVSNESGIDVLVSHAGRSVSIPAGASDGGAFADTTFAGDWRLSPLEIRGTWQRFCSDNPGFEGETGDVAPVPPAGAPAPPSEPPPTLWLRVGIGCP